MLSTLRSKVRVVLALGLMVGSFAINSQAQSVPRITLCEFNETTQITTCDSFGSSAGYYRFQCNTSGSCWAV